MVFEVGGLQCRPRPALQIDASSIFWLFVEGDVSVGEQFVLGIILLDPVCLELGLDHLDECVAGVRCVDLNTLVEQDRDLFVRRAVCAAALVSRAFVGLGGGAGSRRGRRCRRGVGQGDRIYEVADGSYSGVRDSVPKIMKLVMSKSCSVKQEDVVDILFRSAVWR